MKCLRVCLLSMVLLEPSGGSAASPDPEFDRLLKLEDLRRNPGRPPAGVVKGTPEYAAFRRSGFEVDRQLANAGLRYYEQHPEEPLRWDALAIAYWSIKEYSEHRRESPREDGADPSREEWQAEPLRQSTTDEFLTSAEARRIRGLVPQALQSSDIDPVVYAMFAATRIYQIFKNEYPSLLHLTSPRVSRTPETQRQIRAMLDEARELVRSVEKKFPDGAQADDPKRHGFYYWSADAAYGHCVEYYLEMLQRAGSNEEHAAELQRISQARFPDAAARARKELRRLNARAGGFQVSFTALDGRSVDIAALRGKVVLVDFWATWCKPCIQEMPNVQRVYRQYREQGFEVVGISLDHEKNRTRFVELCKQLGVTWPQHFDGRGFQNEFAQKYGVTGVPAMFLLDKEGRVVSTRARGDELEREVRKQLGLPAAEG